MLVIETTYQEINTLSEVKKLTVEQALAQRDVENHNSAVGNVVCALEAMSDARRLLNKTLAELDEDEAWVKKLSEDIEADPKAVNDDAELCRLYGKYGSTRGQKSLFGKY